MMETFVQRKDFKMPKKKTHIKKSARKKQTENENSVFDVSIYELVEGWLAQSGLMKYYCDQMALAKKEAAEAKASRKVILAEIDYNIRKEPKKYGMHKVSESAIQNMVIMQEDAIAANQEVIDAEHKVDVLQGWISSLVDRKHSLENLVTLYGQQYFSVPNAPLEYREMYDQLEKDEVRREGRAKKK